jgi:hypothetical protein
MKWAAWRRTAPTRETRCSATTGTASAARRHATRSIATTNAQRTTHTDPTTRAQPRRARKPDANRNVQHMHTHKRATQNARHATHVMRGSMRQALRRTPRGAPSEDPQQKHEQRRVVVHPLCAALQMRAGSCRCTAPTHACAVALEHVHCPSYPRICFQVRALSGPRHICAGTGGCGFRACTGDQPLLADREDGHALRNVRGRAHAAARRREVKEFDRRRCEQ